MAGMENIFRRRGYQRGATTRSAKALKQQIPWWKKRRWQVACGTGLAVIALTIAIFVSSQPVLLAAPEVPKIIAAQQDLKFGILIPTYMPRGFDRENVELKVLPSGPSGEPVAELTYRNLGKKAAIFFRQWVPGNAEMENLNKSVPIETKWGKGFLMTQGGKSGIGELWVMVGQLRVAIASSNLQICSPEQLLQMANTIGLASEDQVYTFKMDPLEIHGAAPPAPFEVPLNADGIQELNLTITPGGYSPIRFAVKKGIPLKINFRAIGEVGCGNTLTLPMGDGNGLAMTVTKTKLQDTAEFTPQNAGQFQFNCGHFTFRGIMTVRE